MEKVLDAVFDFDLDNLLECEGVDEFNEKVESYARENGMLAGTQVLSDISYAPEGICTNTLVPIRVRATILNVDESL